MKMNLAFDTDIDEDREYLRRMFETVTIKEVVVEKVVEVIKEVPVTKPDKHVRVDTTPYKGGKITDKVVSALEKLEIAAAWEVAKEIQVSEEQAKNAINYLRINGIVEGNSERPMRYFLRKKGNPELASMFPVGTKAEVMR